MFKSRLKSKNLKYKINQQQKERTGHASRSSTQRMTNEQIVDPY